MTAVPSGPVRPGNAARPPAPLPPQRAMPTSTAPASTQPASAVPAGVAPARAAARPPLRRSRRQQLAGVADGLAAHLGWNVGTVRILFVLLSFVSGAGLLLYGWLWALVPLADTARTATGEVAQDNRVTRSMPAAWALVGTGGILAALAAWMVGTTGPYQSEWFWCSILAMTVTVGGALWAGFLDANDPDRGARHVTLVRGTAALVLVAVLITDGWVTIGQRSVSALVCSMLAVIALGVIYAPILVTRLREASNERITRIREEQRSEMAAHLHDSVLQTLALIQNRAGASSEAARLARAQERELRSWLYDGDEPADSDLPTDLRDYAAALELDYPVRIDVVAAGTSTERASGDLAAAAREAMLNAARHAGGEVSVYIEGRGDAVEVYVRDRGPGFSLDGVPADRLGVRQSIIGRMRRAGGSAQVLPGAGGAGTQIRLALRRDNSHASNGMSEGRTP
ncbi:PspC domain-containing protein [Microbacterium gorillae]|uniref:PspC domain-containing protein n=1 Tax=Microbacterium gorillae TaxID=1231063 RepID=UPI003D96533D